MPNRQSVHAAIWEMGTEPVNWEKLMQLVDGDQQLAQELAEILWVDCPTMMANIRQALDRRDAGALFVAAHKVKGSTATIGADSAFHAAGMLEGMGHSGDLSQAEEVWLVLDAEMRRLRAWLAEFTDPVTT